MNQKDDPVKKLVTYLIWDYTSDRPRFLDFEAFKKHWVDRGELGIKYTVEDANQAWNDFQEIKNFFDDRTGKGN